MEQLVLLIIIGAISLINWLIDQSGKRREKRRLEKELSGQESEEPAYRELSPASAETGTETPRAQEMRRFLESFGIPLPEEIEEPVARQEVVAPRQSPPPLLQPPLVVSRKTPAPVRMAPDRFSLKSPAALRQAIVLREILGPPRSLQPF